MIRVRTKKWSFFVIVAFFTLIVPLFTQASAATVNKVHLYATDGYHTLPGGQQVYIWGFTLENKPGTAVFPGPRIEAAEGETIEVTVTNIGASKAGADFEVHPLRFQGIDGNGNAGPALAAGQSDTRQITAAQAGSYYYYSYDSNQNGVQMGFNGPLIVKAKNSVKEAWTGGPAFDKEYVFHMNEIDPAWHAAAESGGRFERSQFHPRYWNINGKSFPDVENDPASMIHGKVGEKILVRLINPGFDEHPMHLHGHHFQVIAENGKPLSEPIDKDTVNLDPGETKDILIVFEQAGDFPFHSHKVLDNTNDGVYPGGLHTMTHIEPAGGANPGTMSLEIGNTHAMVNGAHVMLDVAPFKLNGETYIPFQFIADAFGAMLQTKTNDGSFLYTTDHTRLELWPIQKHALLNGQQSALQSPLIQKNGKAMIPLSVIATSLCAKVIDGSPASAITIEYHTGQECQMQDTTSPTVSVQPAGGNYASAQSVALTVSDNDPNAKIYYTLDGTEPSKTSLLYESPIQIAKTAVLKFIGIDTAGNASQVKTETYTISVPEVIVDVLDDKFSSNAITVKKGATVTWVLRSTMLHTVTSYDGLFDQSLSPDGKTKFSYTFNETGTYGYTCLVHPSSMTGTVTVE